MEQSCQEHKKSNLLPSFMLKSGQSKETALQHCFSKCYDSHPLAPARSDRDFLQMDPSGGILNYKIQGQEACLLYLQFTY
jgi:hypothetical protein